MTLNNKYIVTSRDALRDNKYLFIMMNCYDYNLKQIIQMKNHLLRLYQNKRNIQCFDYIISSGIFIEILHGLQYLHTLNPPIIHRDIKPSNIVCDATFMDSVFCRICDFGLSRPIPHTDKSSQQIKHTTGVGTFGFEPPEAYNGIYETKSDIYSLGRICLELFNIDR